MQSPYYHGNLHALEVLGLAKTAQYKTALIKCAEVTNGVLFGLLIGATLGMHLMVKKDKERTVYPYRLEDPPLSNNRGNY